MKDYFFFSQNKTWKPLEVQYHYYLFSTIVINGVADFSRHYLDPPRCAKYISLGPFLHSALTSLCGAGINYLDFTDEETDGWESGVTQLIERTKLEKAFELRQVILSIML